MKNQYSFNDSVCEIKIEILEYKANIVIITILDCHSTEYHYCPEFTECFNGVCGNTIKPKFIFYLQYCLWRLLNLVLYNYYL